MNLSPVPTPGEEDDLFRQQFKFYKRRRPPPDYSDVIDFERSLDSKVQQYNDIHTPVMGASLGLKPVHEWKVLTHQDIPGFLFIVNPFTSGWQRYWVRQCLEIYPCKPNITNLDAHMTLSPRDNVWHQSLNERETSKSFEKTILHKLRWVTLGYHHNWETKCYSGAMTPMPLDMKMLSQYVTAALGWPGFQPEAAIVNFYHQGSTLSGHTDHSELDHQSPLLSVSFGQTAIFLLGGPTKSTKPVAMYIRSGDIVIMHGPARLCYHGIPRILSPSGEHKKNSHHWDQSPVLDVDVDMVRERETIESSEKRKSLETAPDVTCSDSCMEDVNVAIKKTLLELDFEPFVDYLQSSRINMNIRQVIPHGQCREDLDKLKTEHFRGRKELAMEKPNDSPCEKVPRLDF